MLTVFQRTPLCSFIYTYKEEHKTINNTHFITCIFQIFLSGVSQGSILGPILFNVFINNLFLWISISELLNFAHNTICAAENTIQKLVSTLEKESQAANDWFKSNKMVVNPNKFQAIIVKRTIK